VPCSRVSKPHRFRLAKLVHISQSWRRLSEFANPCRLQSVLMKGLNRSGFAGGLFVLVTRPCLICKRWRRPTCLCV